jgi:hypothetical protein
MNLTLIRLPQHKDGTFGVLLDEGTPFCLTVERPWLDNKRGESCIPTGQYICRRVNSPKFGDTFEVTNVPGRTAILFHKGNIMEDSHGCIILGEQYESLEGKVVVLASGKAFSEFLERTRNVNEFRLEIKKA